MLSKENVCLLLLCVTCSFCQDAKLFDIATQVKETIFEQFNAETSFNRISELISNLTESSLGEIINGFMLLDQIETKIRTKLLLVESLLQESLTVVEQSYSSRIQSPCCSCLRNESNPTICKSFCNTTYHRATVGGIPASYNESSSLSGGLLEQRYSQFFRRNVSFMESAVHVPMDVFDKDPMVICFVDWTENLTAHFIRQRERIDSEDEAGITNQYFGSTITTLRFYPGSTEWSYLYQCQRCPLSSADTYHAPERPWYVQTIHGNKFLAIILDLSGSMSGFRLLLAQIAIVKLLEALTPNDYFYVVGSQSGGDMITSSLHCFMKMTRATPENVLAVSEEVMSYTTVNLTGQVVFSESLKLVYEQFNNSEINRCHDFIVVFTDWNSDKSLLKEALRIFNCTQVRVFTFIVGPPDDNSDLKKISHLYGGNTFHLEYYNDIHQQIINFTTNELHSLISHNVSNSTFWNHYKDVFGAYVLTGSLPFIQTESRELIGVVGVDLNLNWLQDTLKQSHMITAYFYSFMMDNAGYLIFHPQIDQQFINMSSADDPLRFDVRRYEHPINNSEFEKVRWAMMSGESGNYTLDAWIPIERESRYVQRNVTYFYKPVKGTSFSLAIVFVNNALPDIQRVNNTNITENISSIVKNIGLELGLNVFLLLPNEFRCISKAKCEASANVVTPPHNLSVQAKSTHIIALRSLTGPVAAASPVVLGIAFSNGKSLQQNLSILLQNASSSNDVEYFLLDLNGYIVVSGPEDKPGTHLSQIFPSLLQDLVSRGIYREGLIRAYELKPCGMFSLRNFPSCNDNAGFSMYKGILISLYQLIVSFINGGIWMIGQFALLSVMAVLQRLLMLVPVTGQEVTLTKTVISQRNQSHMEPCPLDLCLSQYTAYELDTGFSPVENVNITCADEDILVYDAVRVDETDLLLLSISTNCSDWSTSNHENKYKIPCPCGNLTFEESIPISVNSQCLISNATPTNNCSSSSRHLVSSQLLHLLVAFFVTLNC